MTFGFVLLTSGFLLLDAYHKKVSPLKLLKGELSGKKPGWGLLEGFTGKSTEGGAESSAEVHGAEGSSLTAAGIAAGVAKATSMSGRYPYVWGGGHQNIGVPSMGTAGAGPIGYDCSGAVCAVLHAMGVLNHTEVSGELASFGKPGKGKYVTIYANTTHTFMKIGKLWFGTGSDKQALREGPAWGNYDPDLAAYTARHPVGG